MIAQVFEYCLFFVVLFFIVPGVVFGARITLQGAVQLVGNHIPGGRSNV